MEFILCDAARIEQGNLPPNASVDFDIGGENDVEITCNRGVVDFGMYLICPGTEYGALIEETDGWTNQTEEKWYGNSFRRFLQEYIIEPPVGEDYRIVSGDAHDVMRDIIGKAFGGMFLVPDIPSGIEIDSYQFERYTDALTGFTKMLDCKNGRINIEINQGMPNQPFTIVLSAVYKKNLSGEIEFSSDSKIAVNIKENHRGINHLICLGKGNLEERLVVHLYAQLDGSVSRKQYYTGLKERTAVYELTYADGEEDLVSKGTDRLKQLMNSKSMRMSVQAQDMQIGDIIAGRNYDTGIYLQKPIIRKIVKSTEGNISIEYRVEGEE